MTSKATAGFNDPAAVLLGRSGSNVTCTAGGISVPVQFAGPQGQYPGLDQVNIQLPNSLSGKGTTNVILTVDGSVANTVQIGIK